MERSNYKRFKWNVNSWLRSASLQSLANYFRPLKRALALQDEIKGQA